MLEQTKIQKFEIEAEFKKLKDKLSESGHNDFEEIQDKLYKLDPSAFWQTMKDLHFDGDEPQWAKQDIIDGNPKSDDIEFLKKENDWFR